MVKNACVLTPDLSHGGSPPPLATSEANSRPYQHLSGLSFCHGHLQPCGHSAEDKVCPDCRPRHLPLAQADLPAGTSLCCAPKATLREGAQGAPCSSLKSSGSATGQGHYPPQSPLCPKKEPISPGPAYGRPLFARQQEGSRMGSLPCLRQSPASQSQFPRETTRAEAGPFLQGADPSKPRLSVPGHG